MYGYQKNQCQDLSQYGAVAAVNVTDMIDECRCKSPPLNCVAAVMCVMVILVRAGIWQRMSLRMRVVRLKNVLGRAMDVWMGMGRMGG